MIFRHECHTVGRPVEQRRHAERQRKQRSNFSNGTANDIVLATGTMISASMMFDPTTSARGRFCPESLTPTLDGSLLSHGSLQQGGLLEEQLSTPSAASPLTRSRMAA